ncbi:cytochrome P450 3A24 [Aplysia californica]|uniref:Cytochrome P450 3A24 n=1 Tax=Aplysia californica TaxID=6500 RepID=A0ABM0JW96_APLCA|nr:cytochrome P450 3A24 [Aplysia californica]
MEILGLPIWAILLLLMLVLLLVYVSYMSRRHNTFKDMGIKAVPPTKVFGNLGLAIKHGIFDVQTVLYNMFRDQKCYGYYDTRTPVLVVRDLDMLKDIFVKHFNSFNDRRTLFEQEPPLDKQLLSLKGEDWKRVRNVVSPTFTSGKIKRMTPLVERNLKVLLDIVKAKQEGGEEVELKELCSRFSMDVIASTAFGTDISSQTNPDDEFTKQAKAVMNGISPLLLALIIFFPFLLKVFRWVGLKFKGQTAVEYLDRFVEKAITERKTDGQAGKFNDFVDLLLNSEAHGEGENGVTAADRASLSKAEMHGQSLVFLLAGYETTSIVMAFTLFLIANHPDCLRAAQQEVDQKLGGAFPDHDSIQDLTFLDMCINESMRMFPPGLFIDRVCNEDIEIQGVRIPKGMVVLAPVYAIHHDDEIYPEPDKFKPERFLPENKNLRHPFAFLPFGSGPKNCIGMRFALMEMKMLLAAILQKYTPVSCEKTVYPIKITKMLLRAEKDLWVKFELRK